MHRSLTLFALVPFLFAPAAHADEDAPTLAAVSAERTVEVELSALVQSLGGAERSRTTGVYVAFQRDPVDVGSFPACDDDGDPVVVVSSGLLALAGGVALAVASDEFRGTQLAVAYGPFLASSQRPFAPPLPPPIDVEGREDSDPLVARAEVAAFDDLVAFLVADELAHIALGSFACPHPTATRERADDVWTPAEEGEGLRRAPARMQELARADAWARASLVARSRSLAPADAWLRVMSSLEDAPGRSSYVALHRRRALPQRAVETSAARASLR